MPRGESAPDLCPAFRAPVQGSAEVTVARRLELGKDMTDQRQWYVGVDWASESHHVFLTDADGRKIAERVFKHGGEGLAEMAAWLVAASGAEASQIQVAIEVPHGPVVETLVERAFKVHAINPKQMDRFRDRYTLAGAKDDSRDAQVMASALRTDPRCFRLLAAADPVVIELREWSRIAEDLSAERNRLTNRMREQLWRYFPAMLELDGDLGAEWLLDLWEVVPTPAKALRIRDKTIATLLKRNRIRRLNRQLVQATARSTLSPLASSHPSLSRGRGSSMTWRSSHPCREWEGSSSPRCWQKPSMPCSDEITPLCAV